MKQPSPGKAAGPGTQGGVGVLAEVSKVQERLLAQEVEPAETKLDVDLRTAQTVRQANRTLDINLTTAQAGLWLILQMQI